MGLRSVSALKDVIGEPNQFLHLKFESKPKKEIFTGNTLTKKSHEIHMWILCVVTISHVHFHMWA